MKIILFILLSVITSSYNIIPKRDNGCLQLDLVLIGDFSGSVKGKEGFIADAFSSLTNSLELSEDGVKIGVIIFSDYATVISDLNSNKEDLNAKILSIKSTPPHGNTYLYQGLDASIDMLFGKESRRGYRKMIVVVSDGWVDDPYDSWAVINKMKDANIIICSILIKTEINRPDYMKGISTDCYLESDYETLSSEIKKLDVCS